LAGMIDWMTVGLAEPKSILEATAEYRNASDHLGRFLTECTAPAPGERVSSQSLFYLYVAWAKSTGAPLWKATGFGRAMPDRGFHSAKASNNY
jgi:putative DNA primase/helicase